MYMYVQQQGLGENIQVMNHRRQVGLSVLGQGGLSYMEKESELLS